MSEHIRKFEPQVTHIGTGTWLNNHLAYASVFPPAYRETLVRGEGTRKVSDHCERIMRGIMNVRVVHTLLCQPNAGRD